VASASTRDYSARSLSRCSAGGREDPMTFPIVFISHFRIKEGSFEPLTTLAREVTDHLEIEKRRTLVFLSYADEARKAIAFVHVFGDADAMEAHVEGADARAAAVYEYVEPAGWEIYGRPSAAIAEGMRQRAVSAGVSLVEHPDHVAGFLRLGPG
jgi:hypothetical protein